jgi:hypothetical protein
MHLRIEGLEGYIGDFNAMVRKMGVVPGNTGIEILPVVPVVREGMDKVGRELIGMPREWVAGIGEMSGRVSLKRLSGTGGRETEDEEGEI